jgi:hypothetical protein
MSIEHAPGRSRKKVTRAGATKPINPKILAIVENFDRLPADQIIPEQATRELVPISEWTYRRHPILPRIKISPRRYGNRVGDIRKLARGELT